MIRALFLEELSLWTWLWQSTLFVVIGLAGSFLLRRRPGRACQGLFLAMTAAVLVPVMSVLVGHFGLGLFAPEPVTHEPDISYQVFTMNYDVSPVVPPADVQLDIEPAEIQTDEVSFEPTPVKAAPQRIDIPWRLVLLYGWMIAALILLGRLCVAFVGGIYLLRRTKSHCCERIQRAANSARARLGITKDLRIRCGKEVHSPMIWCWSRRLVLLVPVDLDDSVNWVDVICHELAHWRRRDHLIGLVAELVVCSLPWNPFLWWAKRRMVRLSEQACDDWVLAGGQAGVDYAQSLLNLSPKGQMAFLPTMIGKEKPMKERIYRIVKEKSGDPRIGIRWVLAMTLIAAALTVGVAFAQRRPERFEPPDHERQELLEHRARLEDRAQGLEREIARVKDKLVDLEESGKGEGEEAHALRAELREMRENMAVLKRELRGFEVERRERETRPPWEGREQRHEILRRLEELGHETAKELEKLGAQQPGRSEEAHALHRRMWELNEQMREVRRTLSRQLQDPDRRRAELEDRERPEIDRRMQELVRHLEELKMNARDKERVLHELEEQEKGETEDAHVIRRKLEEIHERMHAVEKELVEVERERAMREDSGRLERVPVPEAMMHEREELGEKARLIELELRELGDEHPERAEKLEKDLHEIHKRIEQMDHFEGQRRHIEDPRRLHIEELNVRREHLQARMQEMEHVLAELNEQGKGESEKAHNLGRELRALHEQLDATERELDNVHREGPQEPERDDLEREVQDLRRQVNSVNEQMGELRELLTRLLDEKNRREHE